ncbi:hypothetical protein Scep_020390 [Stephania cephalantha]|uniref:UspA domain-containing protein n=1 Tax=Stephania cephalantha TaxID=152367 RepID=A0AAP0NQS3_9MAGN
MGLKSVVIAVDGSEESMSALRWAIHNLVNDREEGPAFVVLHVQPPASIVTGLNPGAIPFGGPSHVEVPAFTEAIQAHLKRISDAIIGHASKICSENKVKNVKMEVIVGEPKEVICEYVDKVHADLLVMGSRAYGPIKKCIAVIEAGKCDCITYRFTFSVVIALVSS